jgi:hypothetical protein
MVINELNIIKKINKHDVIYLSKNKNYLLTSLHGSEDGELFYKDGKNFISIKAWQIRKFILNKFGIKIEKKCKIYIFPCYAKSVYFRNKNQFRKNKIEIGFNLTNNITCCLTYKNKIVVLWIFNDET